MKDRERNRNRFFNTRNITIGGGIITLLARVIYNDLKKENGFIKSIYRKITGFYNKEDLNNITDINGSVKIIESGNKKNKQEKIL